MNSNYMNTNSTSALTLKIYAESPDPLFLEGKYSQSFVDELASQITERISRAMGVSGLIGSNIELELIFAPGTYMEHTSENVTYRRLLISDKSCHPRDFWVKWTRLDGAVGYTVSDDVNADTILFELGEDVPQKIREKEYRFLCGSNPDKYQSAMGKKTVTEWRDVIKRCIKRGELTKDISDLEISESENSVDNKLRELLASYGMAASNSPEPEAEKSDNSFDSIMQMARAALAREENDSDTPDIEDESLVTDACPEDYTKTADGSLSLDDIAVEDGADASDDTPEFSLGDDSEDSAHTAEDEELEFSFDNIEDGADAPTVDETAEETEAEDEPELEATDAVIDTNEDTDEDTDTYSDSLAVDIQPVEETPKNEDKADEQLVRLRAEAEEEIFRLREERIRTEVEAKIRLEYEAKARAKAEEEAEKLRREQDMLRRENERLAEAARLAAEEKERRERELLLEAERRRAEEEELRAKIEAQMRQEARERERLAEAARMAVEEQRRIEAERIARENEERQRVMREEAERLAREEQARRDEATRRETERIRRDNEARRRAEVAAAAAAAAEEVERETYVTKHAKLMFRRNIDLNVIKRIKEIVEETLIANHKENVHLYIKAYPQDSSTINLDIIEMPVSEGELLVKIMRAIGNGGLGITKITLE